ncbi:unnamed protein product [Rhodiola kirilowii]
MVPLSYPVERMEGETVELPSDAIERVVQLFRESMARVAEFEQLADSGKELLHGYRQGLEFLRRPPIKRSDLVEKIINSNETQRLKSYFEERKCFNECDSVNNINKLNTCYCGLLDYLTRAKAFVTKLEVLKEETITAMQCANDASIQLCKDPSNIVEEADDTSTSTEGSVSSPSHDQKHKISEYALMTDFIYNMVKKEYTMQEIIVTSLSFKTQSEELESYCLMWSLRPNFDDDVMAEAWELIF